MPEPRGCETSAGFEMKIEAGRMYILAAMGEAHRDVCFVGPFIVGESRVAVDAEHRTARPAGIGDQIGRELI